ncbi:DNA primase small subunit PriS [Halostella pelagica]|uniref:DNA primase small subunit PriS n=1 Tax=Halostella pelagica TaxID=2583824 RepID=UPI0010820ADA|nr:DNA primase small subunit PriS [Halostella pelagica]
MEEHTRGYLRGRFRDHYRRAEITPPPDAPDREWGFIPWTEGPGTTMVRHRSLFDIGSIDEFLQRKRPRHVYFSAGRYEDPSANSMSEKGWRSADLIFDLDADHLPAVDPETTAYPEMLNACKDALLRLLDLLETDFGFEDLTVVFSGGRGYHVHVRDEGVRALDSDRRREIVDYVRGIDVEFEDLVDTEAVAGMGRETPAQKRTLDTTGGWSKRVHDRICAFVDELLAMDEDDALDRLQEFDRIGSGRAEAFLTAATTNADQIRAGNVDVHPAFFQIARTLAEDVLETETAPIDEPVTTDTNRLIRLPGSLHGGSGLEVKRIDRPAIEDFDPLRDAVPETFTGHSIAVDVTDVSDLPPVGNPDFGEVSLNGDTFTVAEGTQTVSEHVGVFLMARGQAEKGEEQ